MPDADFVEVAPSADRLPGRPQIILTGFNKKDFALILKVLVRGEFKIPVLVATRKDLEVPLAKLNSRPKRPILEKFSVLPRAIIVGGVTQETFLNFMTQIKKTSVKRPLWATLTDTSLTWTLSALLSELQAENVAMAQGGAGLPPR